MMKNIRLVFLSGVMFAALATIPTGAQTYNSNSGGWNTGYGTVYGSFGLAMATQNIYNTTQMQIQRLTMRNMMIKKWGLAAVEKAEREQAGKGSSSSGSSSPAASASGPVVEAPPPAPKYNGRFRPVAGDTTFKKIADTIGETPEEKALLISTMEAIKGVFEKETAARGWKNDIGGAFAFFMIANATVYHDIPEPSDEVSAMIYTAVTASVDSVPDFATASNKDKQAIYNTLIAFTAIPFATYAEGKQNGDGATVAVASKLAGEMIRLVLKTDPAKVRFENGSMTVEN